MSRLLSERKLYLILDLDHTILDTSELCYPASPATPQGCKRAECDTFSFVLDENEHFVRFRPGLVDFIRRVVPLYELHVYTAGSRQYAATVLKLLRDLMGSAGLVQLDTLFGEGDCRVMTRDESGDVENKFLEYVVPRGETFTVILDDCADVWESSPDNLMHVWPFNYFKPAHQVLNEPVEKNENGKRPREGIGARPASASKRVRSGDGTAITPLPPHEPDPFLDTVLPRLADILHYVHRCFYNKFETTLESVDVRVYLEQVRNNTFAKCHFIFTGMFPIGSDPASTDLWKRCERYGATCHHQWSDAITHVIVKRYPTEKATLAENAGHSVAVVTLEWLVGSIAAFARLDERLYRPVREALVAADVVEVTSPPPSL